MASLSSGLEGLNLGAAAPHEDGDERSQQLGAIPKRPTGKSSKSERNKNRNRAKKITNTEKTEPLTEEDPNLVPATTETTTTTTTTIHEEEISGKKLSSSQRRSRRGGKRQLKSSPVEVQEKV